MTNKTVAVGGSCSSDDACATKTCLFATDGNGGPTGWTGGYCSGDCSTTSCPQGKCQALADGRSYCLSSCSSDGDCRSGYVCDKSLSVCLPDCRKNWSCGSTLTCNQSSGHCEPPSKTIQVGGACIYNVSCTTGTCFSATDSSGNATGWADGYCSGDCASASCPQGKCQALADGKSYCLSSCSSDGDCRSGYVCDKSLSVCLPDCRKNWSCGSTLTCNQSSGNCEPPSKTIEVGGACIYNVSCTTGTCFPATDSSGNATGWTEGYCSGDCASASCPQGKCQALADGKSYCLFSCSSNTQCRSGYVCATAVSVCLPDCRKNWSCGSTLTCNQSSGNCE